MKADLDPDHFESLPQTGSTHLYPVKYTGPVKYRLVAGTLAILLGTFGAHKFYMNQSRKGFLYIAFLWSGIPSILGIIEGILYLTDREDIFNARLVINSETYPVQPTRDKILTATLAFTLGTFGAHKFFMKKKRQGILYACFIWTGVPTILGFIEACLYLSDKNEVYVARLSAPDNCPPKQIRRDKIVAGLLGIILGFVGAQRFFLRDPKAVWHAIFFWTGIPFIIGFIEGIIILLESPANFSRRYYY